MSVRIRKRNCLGWQDVFKPKQTFSRLSASAFLCRHNFYGKIMLYKYYILLTCCTLAEISKYVSLPLCKGASNFNKGHSLSLSLSFWAFRTEEEAVSIDHPEPGCNIAAISMLLASPSKEERESKAGNSSSRLLHQLYLFIIRQGH